MKTILLGGLDPAFLDRVRTTFGDREDGYVLRPLASEGACRDHLARQEGDVLVLDLDGQGGACLHWLRVVSELRASLPIIALGQGMQPDVEAFDRAHPGAYFPYVTYLRRPLDPVTLLEAVRQELQGATWGTLQGLSLPTLLQMLSLEQKTCTLRVTSGRRQGFFYLQQGQLINARYRRLEGMEALRLLVMAPLPKVEITSALHDTTRTIDLRLEEILMQAVQFLDETPQDARYPAVEEEGTAEVLPDSEVGKWERPEPGPATAADSGREPAATGRSRKGLWAAVAALGILGLGAGGWALRPHPVVVRVESSPAGAQVILEGRPQGLTPLQLTFPDKPQGALRLEKAGFEPLSRGLAPEDRSLTLALRPRVEAPPASVAPLPVAEVTSPEPRRAAAAKSKAERAAPAKAAESAKPSIFDQLRKERD